MSSQAHPQTQEELLESLEQMSEKVERLEKIITKLEERIQKIEEENGNSTLSSDFAELPNSLQKTILAISKLKEANANQIAQETHRTRGIESLYLNQLHHMGYVEKIKRGKRAYFRALRII